MRPVIVQELRSASHVLISYRLLYLGVIYICCSLNPLSAQKVYHTVQLNGGAIVQDVADLYVGKLDYTPQYSIQEGLLRVGLQVGTFLRSKSLDLSYGINAGLRIYKVEALDNNLTLGALYLKPSYEWTTGSERLFSTALMFEFSQIAMNLSYTRDLHFDQNWWSYGFSIRFSKAVVDDFE